MAQAFNCLCGKPTCRGRISGANDMTPVQLEGLWLNGHIRELLEEQQQQSAAAAAATTSSDSSGATRRGPTSRELSGEMGGDTLGAVAA